MTQAPVAASNGITPHLGSSSIGFLRSGDSLAQVAFALDGAIDFLIGLVVRILAGIDPQPQSAKEGRRSENEGERIFADLAEIDRVPSRLFIDSSCIKVHRTAGGVKGGPWIMVSASPKAAGTLSSYAICDEKGRPHVLLLTPGDTHDAKVAMLAINAVPPDYLVADKGYDSNASRSWLIERCTTPVIPSKFNRKVQIEHDRQIYRQRNVVERMFCRFKDWRRVATRFERDIKTFTATIAIGALVTWWL